MESVLTFPLEPRALDAERALLGALLVSPGQLVDVAEQVVAESFYRDAHQCVFRALLTLHDRRATIDGLTVRDVLAQRGELERVGGAAYLAALTDGMPRSSHARAYAEIVRREAIRRELLRAARATAEDATGDDGLAEDLVERAQARFWSLATEQRAGGLVSGAEGAREALQWLEARVEAGPGLCGIPTGLIELDAHTDGLQRSDLVILGARPSMGKTALALTMVTAACRAGRAVSVFSLEMSRQQLMQRLCCAISGLDLQRVRRGMLREEDYRRYGHAAAEVGAWRLGIDDGGGATVRRIRSECRRQQASEGLDLVVVDYVQLMEEPGRARENRTLELGAISRGLKVLARELNVPILLLAQLNRGVETRASHRPQLSDLRDSGALEQDADVVLLLWREEEYTPTPENRGLAEIVVAKQRNGPTATVQAAFWRETATFRNLEGQR